MRKALAHHEILTRCGHSYAPNVGELLVFARLRGISRRASGRLLGENREKEAVVTQVAERITVDPEQCGGRPCIRGMRIRVVDVLDLLANGLTPEQIVEEMPDLELEDVYASLRFASRRLDHPVVAA